MANLFGGDWTEEKLKSVSRYLSRYTTALKNQAFDLNYIDAFAGTGYRERRATPSNDASLFPELGEADTQSFIEGSARIALQSEPPFQRYFFIEKDLDAFSELSKLKAEFPQFADRIKLRNEDANSWLLRACASKSYWMKNRAVAFLDPFGMQVSWTTIEAIAQTKAIDLWILFPLGVAVNRLLRRDGQIEESWRSRLNNVFGTDEWFDRFYEQRQNLFGEVEQSKVVNLEEIGRYYNERLKSIFPGVANNPKPLLNSRNNPLYLLCFAVSNPSPKAQITALRMTQHILNM